MRSSLAQTPMRFCIPSIWPSLPRSSRKRCVLSRASRRSPGLLALSAVGGGQRKNSRVEIGTTVIDMRYDNPTQVRPRAIGGRNCCCNWAQRAELDVNFDESGKPSYIQQASLNRTLCCAWYGTGARAARAHLAPNEGRHQAFERCRSTTGRAPGLGMISDDKRDLDRFAN